jgi:hypothetical protein
MSYTFGWIVELALGGRQRRVPLGPTLLMAGLWVSLAAVLLPTLSALVRLLAPT